MQQVTGISGRTHTGQIKWNNSSTLITGIRLVIRKSGAKQGRHNSIHRASLRVACRNSQGQLICRYRVVGDVLNPSRETVGFTPMRNAWNEITQEYADHMGLERPANWLRSNNRPQPEQFAALAREMKGSGVVFDPFELALIKNIK